MMMNAGRIAVTLFLAVASACGSEQSTGTSTPETDPTAPSPQGVAPAPQPAPPPLPAPSQSAIWRYTIKLNVVMSGVDQIDVDDSNNYDIGQTVSISPKQAMSFQSKSGSVTINPGVTITGKVTAKQQVQ